MDELNPNHPVTRTMHDEWHKIVAVLMHQLGMTAAEITEAHLEAFARDYPGGAVVADCRNGRFMVRLVSAEEGERLARKEGGLPS
jgi:hypothetical protein